MAALRDSDVHPFVGSFVRLSVAATTGVSYLTSPVTNFPRELLYACGGGLLMASTNAPFLFEINRTILPALRDERTYRT